MKLTVVMSVYNGEKFLREAIESILKQTFSDFKFLIVNNSSTDGTAEILEDFRQKDQRIRVITNNENLTYVEGRMLALKRVKTEWVALMDADDISHPERLQTQVDFIKKYGDKIGALGVWGKHIGPTGKTVANSTFGATSFDEFNKLNKNNEAIGLIDPTAVLHLPTFNEVGGYRPETVPAADLDLWYRMAETGRAIMVLPKFLFKYRVHGSAGSVQGAMLQRKKTHFINYNMRLRRSGVEEIIWEEYCRKVWSKPFYRLLKLRTDYAMVWYKKAGFSFVERRYVKMIPYLFFSILLKPEFALKRLYKQKFQ